MVALCDLQRDMEAIAEAGQATSLAGAALQLLLGANAAAESRAPSVKFICRPYGRALASTSIPNSERPISSGWTRFFC